MTRALVIVDVQNDFCEGGSLAVEGGAAVARAVSDHLRDHRDRYDVVVATKDWHIEPGSHFAPKSPDYRTTWPVHCVAGTPGAEFHPDLDTSTIDALFVKGRYEAAYSGFEAVHVDSGEPLADYLRARGVDQVDIAGIATDYCDRATALDAHRLGFETRLLVDLTAGVAPETTADALAELERVGVAVVSAAEG